MPAKKKVPDTSFGHFAVLWDHQAKDAGTKAAQPSLKEVASLLGKTEGKTFYDLATGNGYLARALVRGKAAEVYASDISAEMIDIAVRDYPSEGIAYSVREATDVRRLPKAHFDHVLMIDGLSYVRDLDALASGVAALLKPGGSFVFTMQHPLMPAFRSALGETLPGGEPLNLVQLARHYLRSRTEVVERRFRMGDVIDTVRYRRYARPLSAVVAALKGSGLMIRDLREPKSQGRFNSKTVTRIPIPSVLVIEAAKPER